MLKFLTNFDDINLLGQNYQIKTLIIITGIIALLILIIILTIFIILKLNITSDSASKDGKIYKIENTIIDTEEEIGKMRQEI